MNTWLRLFTNAMPAVGSRNVTRQIVTVVKSCGKKPTVCLKAYKSITEYIAIVSRMFILIEVDFTLITCRKSSFIKTSMYSTDYFPSETKCV
jgi:hypothetical protein